MHSSTSPKKELTPSQAASREVATEHIKAGDFLRAVYLRVKESRKNYSYRKFAEDLGYKTTNYLHLVCTGKRKLTIKAMSHIANQLDLRGDTQKYLELLVEHERTRSGAERSRIFENLVRMRKQSLPQALDRDMLEYLSVWYNPVIREMASLPSFRDDPHWIAQTIFPRITHEEARQALELLKRLGMLVESPETGQLVPQNTHIKTGSSVRSMAVLRYHQVSLEIARNALITTKAQERDFQAITIPISEGLVEEFKMEITQFWQRLMQKSENCATPDRVYQLNIQLFPLTQYNEEEK